jgi:hypothetical protein
MKGEHMALSSTNTSLLTIGWVTKTALSLFLNTNSFLKLIRRQYEGDFGVKGNKVGNQIKIRLPNDFTVRQGQTAQVQAVNETNVVLTIANQVGVDWIFTSAERYLQADYYEERYIKSAVNATIGNIAATIAANVVFSNVIRTATTAGTLANVNANSFLLAKAALVKRSAPIGAYNAVLDPTSSVRMVNSLTNIFNPQKRISDQYLNGDFDGRALGIDFYQDQTVDQVTAGSWTTFTLAATIAAGTNGTPSTITVGSISSVLVGDFFTFASIYAVNQVTKQTASDLKQFTVTSIVSSTQIAVYPPIIPPTGSTLVPYQTVASNPASNAVATNVFNPGDIYRQNLVFHPEAITIAFAELDIPKGGIVEGDRQSLDGVSLRNLVYYNGTYDQWAHRLDTLFGYAYVRPEWGTIVADAP